MYIDFHTHKRRHLNDPQILEVISVHPGKHHADGFFTIGYHPWWTESVPASAEKAQIASLMKSDPGCLAVGECGLDSLKGPSSVIQEEVFRSQILLANDLGVPVIVHCVRAYNRLLEIRREIGKTDWVVHGFMRNKTLARQLLEQGIYLSMAPYDGMTERFRETIAYCPSERLFLETDSDPNSDIRTRYTIAAMVRNIDIETLQDTILNNFKYFFRWKEQARPGWSVQNY